MTIDERLERLTERHEALTQSLEFLTADIQQMTLENRERDRRLAESRQDTNSVMEAIARLLHIAEIHERRLTDLEGGH